MVKIDENTSEIRIGKLVFLVMPHFKAENSDNISDKLKKLLESEAELINMRKNA